ncbi:MAG TPA: outer membrane protein transport protein [Gemmatimonadales bacterium]|nr:outer membrane protein transport protein [Gemmatimonadales bacterium]HRZ09012.1 outer membrane protein transport protein [Gemmatimonadales bacterium]
MRRFQVWIAAGVLTAVLVMPRPVEAQGFSVNEHGSCSMGRGGTGVASPCADGSAIFINPAGLLLAKGKGVTSAGATMIRATGDFTNSTTGEVSSLVEETHPVPALFMGYGLSDNATIGFGVFAPYGLAIEWPTTAEGRFLGYYSSVKGIYFQPSFGLKASDRLSFGIGFDITSSSVELKQRVDLADQEAAPGVTFANLGVAYGTDFADVQLAGNDISTGFHIGAIAKLTDDLSFGIRYLSKQTVNVDDGLATITQVETNLYLAPGNPLGLPAGTPIDALVAPQFQPGGSLVNQGGTATLPYPAQLSMGLTLQATDKLRLLGDVGIQYWSVWETLPLNFALLGEKTIVENYKNTTSWRLGAEYLVGSKSTARLGIIAHNAAAPDQTVTPNLPEAARTEFTAGFGSRINERFGFDLAYQYIDQADRQGRSGDGGMAVPTAALNDGVYTFQANLVGITLTYSF